MGYSLAKTGGLLVSPLYCIIAGLRVELLEDKMFVVHKTLQLVATC